MDATSEQRELLAKLENESRGEFSYEWNEERGVLSFARSEELMPARPQAAIEGADPAATLVADFLEKYGPLFGSSGEGKGLRDLRRKGDDLGFVHLEYQQVVSSGEGAARRRPLEVYGAKLAAHVAPGGRLVEVQSSCEREAEPANTVKVTAASLRAPLLERLQQMEGFRELAARMEKRGEKLFPLMQQPRLVLYPWQGKLIHAWATYGYGIRPKEEQEDPEKARDAVMFGHMFFDAETGELFLFAPTRKGAETAASGSGLSSIPLGGPFANRSLDVVRVDMTSTYRLKNTTKARNIVTYDANANSSWVYPDIPSLIDAGTIPVSEDTDGDHNWSRTAASTSNADRTSSQQPEVDEHATCAELQDWYAAIGGRVGWDDDQYSAPLVPDQTINAVAHTYDGDAGTSRSVNAFFDQELVSGHWVSHLAFFDGDPDGSSGGWTYDYLAGSKAVVGHEYQHAITDFSFVDGSGNPGLTYSDWLAAVHEGLSDVFGGLFSGNWWMANDISPTGQIFRNLAFPRDSAAADSGKFDHWDDRNNKTGSGARYFRGDILAHAAYLMAQGGVHQRSSRTPVLIPVRGLGRETAGGVEVYKAARIWYRAIAHYLSNIGTTTGLPANDESVFRTIRNGCVSAAIDLYGAGSVEHKTTILAWYAVGLQPVATNYGPDTTFLTWGADWWMSRPYVGISSPDWSSNDLFINNGGVSESNAQINVMDGGTPTQFENNVYFRVRNVGDQQANNVQVQFEYTKITAGGATWLPMTDKDGNIQTLSIGNLAAGASNFPDSDQNSPPATARVKWWIPPLEAGETVDHFCIRARVFSINDVNPHNNEVQSNVAYTAYVPGAHLRLGFFVGNDRREEMPLQLLVTHTLPEGWSIRFLEPLVGVVLKPGETRRLHAELQMPAAQGDHLTAPFDGRIRGKMSGEHAGTFTGTLHRARLTGSHLIGEVGLTADDGTHVTGVFDGRLDLSTAQIRGRVAGTIQRRQGGSGRVGVEIEGCLRPDRLVNIGQVHAATAIGGASFQVQVPLPQGTCFEPLPPTDTQVSRPGRDSDRRICLDDAEELIKCLDVTRRQVCGVEVRSVILEVMFRREESC